MERASQIKILGEISILKTNPFAGKPLRGDWNGVYSLRIGTYRVLYSIKETQINLLLVDTANTSTNSLFFQKEA